MREASSGQIARRFGYPLPPAKGFHPPGIGSQSAHEVVSRRHLFFDAFVNSAIRPPAHFLEYSLSRIEFRTVWGLDDGIDAFYAPNVPAPMAACSVPDQRPKSASLSNFRERFDRVFLGHRLDPSPMQFACDWVDRREEVSPLSPNLRELHNLNAAHAPDSSI